MIIHPRFGLDQHHSTAELFLRHFQIPVHLPDNNMLQRVLKAFSNLPYENLSKIIKFNQIKGEWDRLRMPEEVWVDYLENHLGGTCYSLTYFLWSILYRLGYQADPIVMDMTWGQAVHCGLVLRMADEDYLVDPGYLISTPLPIRSETVIRIQDEDTRLELEFCSSNQQYRLYSVSRDQKKFRYSFILHPLDVNDFLLYWKDSFYQKSMRHLCLTRIDRQQPGRIYIRDDFVKHYSSQRNTKIHLPTVQAIQQFFNIPPAIWEEARSVLDGPGR
ncbi:MAG: arylamine N-acetyltransferase [Candidatus Delongbacteria bacterium]|nr:arylamine N-acetyltransferase [Candidatus Delongbacteria bacterium]